MFKSFEINTQSFAYQVLLRMYGSSDRHYHTTSHIDHMLSFAKNDPNFTINVAYAIMYHDAIYIPGKEENEYASATFFNSMCEAGLTDDLFIFETETETKPFNKDKICNLIKQTKYHRFIGDPENDLLMKADLLWFYKDNNGYPLINENLIRKEYHDKSTYKYLTGRMKFLTDLKKTLEEDGVIEDYKKGIDSNILYLEEEFIK